MCCLTLLLIFGMISHLDGEIISCNGGECNCPSRPPTPSESCTLDCGSEDICKGLSLKCRDNVPCTVRCDAKNSCSDGAMINGFTATDVTVLCGGENGCKGGIEIICGTGQCTLNCFGSTSCDEFGEVFTETAKGFMCNGLCPLSVPAPFSASPSYTPSRSPSPAPTIHPTNAPTDYPTPSPTPSPTLHPTNAPSFNPTDNPTSAPTLTPTNNPTSAPTTPPSNDPTNDPTQDPTTYPTINPSFDPTFDPTKDPTTKPTLNPSYDPTKKPTNNPSTAPTTAIPSVSPTSNPTMEPITASPTIEPTVNTAIVMLTEHIYILPVKGSELDDMSTVIIASIAIFGVFIVICMITRCVKKRSNDYEFKASMVPSIEPQQTEIVEIIEGVTASSFYTITVHYDDDTFKYKLIGAIGNTGDTDNCHWNASTYDNFIDSIAKQFGLEWGGFALFEVVDGIHIDIEEMDDIIAGFDADGGKEMSVYVKNGYRRRQRKITRESIHLYHGTPFKETARNEGSDSDSYGMMIRPNSNDTLTLTDSNN